MNWIKKTGAEQARKPGGKDVVIADSKDRDCVRKIEMGVQQGSEVLLLDVGEELDPVLDNVLNKSLIKVATGGGRSIATFAPATRRRKASRLEGGTDPSYPEFAWRYQRL